jgi:hypothetical protein
MISLANKCTKTRKSIRAQFLFGLGFETEYQTSRLGQGRQDGYHSTRSYATSFWLEKEWTWNFLGQCGVTVWFTRLLYDLFSNDGCKEFS